MLGIAHCVGHILQLAKFAADLRHALNVKADTTYIQQAFVICAQANYLAAFFVLIL
jgi:hypothetical protein